MSGAFATDALAEWVVAIEPEQLPEDVLAKAADCVLDAVSCAMAGRTSPAVYAVEAAVIGNYRSGCAGIWYGGTSSRPVGAAFVNATAASILDIDDGHRAALGHPGAAVVPAALAAGAETGADGRRILAAVVAGYEAAVRIGAGERRKAYHTGNWSSFGAAAAAAYLGGHDADGTAQALAVTAYHGPRVADLTLSADMGRSVKESIPWSVVAGMTAAELAARGFTGCRDALDIEERFDPALITAGLGADFKILGTYFKRYSSCRWTHAAVEMLLRLMAENGLGVEDVTRVRVETFDQAVALDNLSDPPTLESAQYSVRYCMGLAATRGETALMPLTPSGLGHAPAAEFAERIELVAVDDMNALFPGRAPARVIVTSAKGVFAAETDTPWGEPATGIGRAELVEKFRNLAGGRMSEARVREIAGAVDAMQAGDIFPLFAALAEPLDKLQMVQNG